MVCWCHRHRYELSLQVVCLTVTYFCSLLLGLSGIVMTILEPKMLSRYLDFTFFLLEAPKKSAISRRDFGSEQRSKILSCNVNTFDPKGQYSEVWLVPDWYPLAVWLVPLNTVTANAVNRFTSNSAFGFPLALRSFCTCPMPRSDYSGNGQKSVGFRRKRSDFDGLFNDFRRISTDFATFDVIIVHTSFVHQSLSALHSSWI